MRLYLINPTNPLVSSVTAKESRWNRYRVWKPLSLMVLASPTGTTAAWTAGPTQTSSVSGAIFPTQTECKAMPERI